VPISCDGRSLSAPSHERGPRGRCAAHARPLRTRALSRARDRHEHARSARTSVLDAFPCCTPFSTHIGSARASSLCTRVDSLHTRRLCTHVGSPRTSAPCARTRMHQRARFSQGSRRASSRALVASRAGVTCDARKKTARDLDLFATSGRRSARQTDRCADARGGRDRWAADRSRVGFQREAGDVGRRGRGSGLSLSFSSAGCGSTGVLGPARSRARERIPAPVARHAPRRARLRR